MAKETSFLYDEILEQGPVFAPVQTTGMSNRRPRFRQGCPTAVLEDPGLPHFMEIFFTTN